MIFSPLVQNIQALLKVVGTVPATFVIISVMITTIIYIITIIFIYKSLLYYITKLAVERLLNK